MRRELRDFSSTSQDATEPSPWRNTLRIHPAAELFPLMPPDELRALGEDIRKADGLTSPIAIYIDEHKADWFLDGRNRLDAMELVGIPFQLYKDRHGRWALDSSELFLPDAIIQIESPADPVAYVISANIHRRHLKAEQKRELIADVLKAAPEKSDRQIGEMVKADHKTVGAVRAQQEATGEIPQLKNRVGKDRKARKQPASRGWSRERWARHRARKRGGKAQATTAAESSATFEVGADFKGLLLNAPGWTGATAETQRDVDAAVESLRDDGAPGHWLVLAPRERVVVDYRVIGWLLLTTPALPAIVHMEWVLELAAAANKARCPVWVSERLTGKSHPRGQRAGMTWPRELPIPQQTPRNDIGPNSPSEIERLQARVEELQIELQQRDLTIAGLRRRIAELEQALPQTVVAAE
jgi:hypothetical protein